MNASGKNGILIIDDEVSNLRLLTHMLGQEYTVYAAKDGRSGIEMAQEHKPDLILLDIVMPEMDGHEVFARLRAHEETKHIPVIFATGLDADDGKTKDLMAQAADCISKPFNAENVKAKVRNQIEAINQ